MTWEEFEVRLARVKRDARARTYVVIQRARGRGLAEFAVDLVDGELTLTAEVSVPVGRFDLQGGVAEAGFVEDPTIPGLWARNVVWPVSSREFVSPRVQ